MEILQNTGTLVLFAVIFVVAVILCIVAPIGGCVAGLRTVNSDPIEDYTERVVEITHTYERLTDNFIYYELVLTTNPERILEERWRNDVTASIVELRDNNTALRTLEAPEEHMVFMNTELQKALEGYNASEMLFDQAMREASPETFFEGMTHLRLGNSIINQAKEKMREFRGQSD